MPLTADQFAKAVVAAGLSSVEEIKAVWGSLPSGGRPKDGESFAQVLVERGKLTPFQAAELVAESKTPLVLGDYVLLGRIGAGGMGQVFKAQHRHMERVVAIKLLSEAMTKDGAAVQRFQREVKAAAKLVHPNIVQAYDASMQKGVWYLVMEHVDGRDLANIVAAGAVTIDDALDYIRQAARGLAFAHSRGVVHRDIKPANLLLDQAGTVKILDMGLARFEDQTAAKDGLTQSGQVMGTIDYMAPEQAFDTHTADARADVYSLGCTLYRLLTGKNLYEGDTIVRKLMAHQTRPIPSLVAARPDASAELARVFEKMVAKLPAERFQSMDELLVALDELAGPAGGSGSYSAGGKSKTGRGIAVAPQAPSTVEVAPTVSLSNPQQSTDPVSDRSIQVARSGSIEETRRAVPWWRQRSVHAVGGVLVMVFLLTGAWQITNRLRGHKPAQIQIPPGGSVKVVSPDEEPPKPPGPPPGSKSSE